MLQDCYGNSVPNMILAAPAVDSSLRTEPIYSIVPDSTTRCSTDSVGCDEGWDSEVGLEKPHNRPPLSPIIMDYGAQGEGPTGQFASESSDFFQSCQWQWGLLAA
jgi:hypothetical protein